MNLILLCLFFFIISWFYANALKTMFKHNFKWHLAAVVGIMMVGSTTAWFVWQFQEPLTFEYAWSTLVLVFTAALPGMAYHGEDYLKQIIKIRNDLQTTRTRMIDLDMKNMTLERERNQLRSERELLKNQILPMLERIEKNQNEQAATELAELLRLRLWAQQRINRN